MNFNVLKGAVLLDLDDTKISKVCISQQSVKRENIKCMMTKVQSSNTLDEVRSLMAMSGQVATPQQQDDLLGFWEVGHERNHIIFFVL